MSKHPTDVEEVSGAAAEIENPQRWRAIEPKILNTLDVDADPIFRVFECVDPSCITPVRRLVAQFRELVAVNCRQNAF